jgi:hypothetical protein
VSRKFKGRKLTGKELEAFFKPPTVYDLLPRHYAPLPAPTKALMIHAQSIAEFVMALTNTQTVGIIAVCEASDGNLYAGFSPALQEAVFAYAARISTDTAATVYTRVDDRILHNVQVNKGCAEKKLMSAMLALGLTMKNLAVVEYPLGGDPGGLAKHVGLGSGQAVFYTPCDSCRAAWSNYIEAARSG